mmetsp:Transcript_60587/g.169272  ORF Transcript_60587/g.169272 Transcript_60587/m.169272 type:complete len:147 (-) Transcript_60587:14-454(-)
MPEKDRYLRMVQVLRKVAERDLSGGRVHLRRQGILREEQEVRSRIPWPWPPLWLTTGMSIARRAIFAGAGATAAEVGGGQKNLGIALGTDMRPSRMDSRHGRIVVHDVAHKAASAGRTQWLCRERPDHARILGIGPYALRCFDDHC